jgi:hypothetical protein
VHPRTKELLDHLERSYTDFRNAVDEYPLADRERRPAPERWSVTEIVDHLAVVEQRVARVLSGQLADARAKGLPGESDDSSVMGMMRMDRLLDRRRPITTPETSLPRGGVDAATAWSGFEEANRSIRELAAASDGMALGEISVPHPAFGPLNLYQWFLFVGGHESRHALQVREMLQQPQTPDVRPTG